jgi:hypothetical protein
VAQTITNFADAEVNLRFNSSEIASQLGKLEGRISKIGSAFQTASRKLTLISAPAIAFATVSVNKFFNTMNPAALKAAWNFRLMRYQWEQFTARVGRVAVEKFQLDKLFGRIADALSRIKPETIDRALGAIKWVAIGAALFKVLGYMKELVTLLQWMQSIGALKLAIGGVGGSVAGQVGGQVAGSAVGAIGAGAGAGAIGAGAVSFVNTIENFEKTMSEYATKLYDATKAMQNGDFKKIRKVDIKSYQKVLSEYKSPNSPISITNVGKSEGAMGKFISQGSRMAKFESIKALGKIFFWVVIPLRLINRLFGGTGDTLSALATTLWVIIDIFKILDVVFETLLSPLFALIDAIKAIFKGENPVKAFGKSMEKEMNKQGEEFAKIWENFGKSPLGEKQKDEVLNRNFSVSTVSAEGLNKAMQDFYSQNVMMKSNQNIENNTKQTAENTAKIATLLATGVGTGAGKVSEEKVFTSSYNVNNAIYRGNYGVGLR